MQNKKLNILEINFSTAWGGLEMQLPVIGGGLKALGHNVVVACSKGSRIAEKVGQLGLKVVYLENRLKYVDLFAIWRLIKIIKENKIDVIHCHMGRDLWLAVPSAKIAGCRKIFFTCHMESNYRKRDLLHFFLHRSITGAVAITEKVKECLINTTHIPPGKIKVIYCGLDLDKYHPGSFPGNILRKEYGFPEDFILIGIVGRLDEGKGQEYLLKAAPLVLNKFPRVKFIIVGEETIGNKAGYRCYLELLVKELGLGNNVTLTGFRQDIPEIISSMDILVLASKREAFGLVNIEAMALGKTVIAVESSGVREIIDNGIDGFLIPVRDSVVLAEEIIRVLGDPEKMKQTGIMARKKVEEKFDFNKNIEELENLFRAWDKKIGSDQLD